MALIAVVLVSTIAFLFYIKPVFIALVFGVLVTVLLDKIVDAFGRATANYSPHKKKAVVLIGSAAIVIAVGIVLIIGAVNLSGNINTMVSFLEDFSNQYNESAENMASDIANISAEDTLTEYIFTGDSRPVESDMLRKITSDPPSGALEEVSAAGLFGRESGSFVLDILQSLLASGGDIMDSTTGMISMLTSTLFASCLVIPVMAGYYFKEKGKIRSKIVGLSPVKYKVILDRMFQDVTSGMSAFAVTKIMEAVVIIFLYCIGFYTIGIPHWLFAGIVMGAFNAIPYIGFIIPSIPIAVYAYTLGMDVLVAVLGIVILVQLFDCFFILPNMVMKTVKISSFTAVILTLAGLKLFGLFGLLFAVPIYILCKIVMISAYKMLVVMYPDPINLNETKSADTSE